MDAALDCLQYEGDGEKWSHETAFLVDHDEYSPEHMKDLLSKTMIAQFMLPRMKETRHYHYLFGQSPEHHPPRIPSTTVPPSPQAQALHLSSHYPSPPRPCHPLLLPHLFTHPASPHPIFTTPTVSHTGTVCCAVPFHVYLIIHSLALLLVNAFASGA